MGTFSFLFACQSVMALVFCLISDPRGMLFLRQGLVEGDFVDVRAVFPKPSYDEKSEPAIFCSYLFCSNEGLPETVSQRRVP